MQRGRGRGRGGRGFGREGWPGSPPGTGDFGGGPGGMAMAGAGMGGPMPPHMAAGPGPMGMPMGAGMHGVGMMGPAGSMMGPPQPMGMGMMPGPMVPFGGPMAMHQGMMLPGPPGPMPGQGQPQMDRAGPGDVGGPSDRQGPGGGGGGGGELPGVSRAKNDYCQHFVDTGARPQNFLLDCSQEDRYSGYPQLQRLIELKDQQVEALRTPPYGLRADLKKLRLSKELFGTRFDVILIDPPWEEYVRRAPGLVSDPEAWSWQDIQALNIDAIADSPSFVFLWCGSAEGLDAGRHCLRKWGFRRSEDICWIKTNQERDKRKYLIPTNQVQGSMLVHTKEHCLLGIRGNLQRNLDGHILHTNIDTDVIVSEEPPLGSTEKPEELYNIIERFAAGRRRLELFGEDRNMRAGWVTVGKRISQTNFKKQAYLQHFKDEQGVPYDEHRGGRPPLRAPVLVPSTAEIDELRPRSPVHQGGRGRGR